MNAITQQSGAALLITTDSTGNAQYTAAGNNSCAPHAAPIAVFAASPLSGTAPVMPNDVVHKRLEEIGKFVRGERKRQQIWQVPDPSFSHVIVGFDANDRLRYVTAVAREDEEAKRL